MFYGMKSFCRSLALAMFAICCVGSAVIAEDAAWHISKSSGDVWVTVSGAQEAALTNDAVLRSGDTIRTGRNGRVLLTRGQESILISPNSVIGISTENTEGLSTTIVQQAGSILLDVEKRNVKHFEVVTPYLAAVVKGTRFRVSVNRDDSGVDVLRGEVEVSGFQSGQHATVLPGQAAKVATVGRGDLSLSGSGTLSPIQQGEPRRSPITPIAVPQEGLSAPASAANGYQVRVAPPLGEFGSTDAQQVRVAAAAAEARSVWSGGSAADKNVADDADEDINVNKKKNANKNTWGFGLLGWGGDAANGRDDDNIDKGTITVVIGIGIAVAVATGARRRMQKRTQRRS